MCTQYHNLKLRYQNMKLHYQNLKLDLAPLVQNSKSSLLISYNYCYLHFNASVRGVHTDERSFPENSEHLETTHGNTEYFVSTACVHYLIATYTCNYNYRMKTMESKPSKKQSNTYAFHVVVMYTCGMTPMVLLKGIVWAAHCN